MIGKKVLVDDLINHFKAPEGAINMYYGLIGNGKTYSATSDVLDLLAKGRSVYVNWRINVEDYDDREHFWPIFFNFFLFRKRFYRIPCADNLHFFDPDTFNTTASLVEWLSGLNDCDIFFDEGQIMFDSYEGTSFSKAKRRLILHTRHYHRSLNIISQRPTAIQVSARGNVNRFYKCKKIASWPFLRFARFEFQEMVGETVNEAVDPISVKTYFGRKRIFRAYNTDYLSEGIPKSQVVNFEAYDLTFRERLIVSGRWFRKIYAEFKHIFRNRKDSALAFPAIDSFADPQKSLDPITIPAGDNNLGRSIRNVKSDSRILAVKSARADGTARD